MARVVDAGMTNCPVLVVLWLVVGLRLMVGSRGMVGCRCHHRGVIRRRGWLMVGWGRGCIWRRFMVGWCRWGIRSWLMVGWRRRGIGGRFVIGRGRRCVRGWWWWWRRGVWCRGRGIWLRGMDNSRGVGGRGRCIGGGSSPKVCELGEPLDPLVLQVLLQVHLLAVKTVKA